MMSPLDAETSPQLLFAAARAYPERIAIADGDVALTFPALAAEASRFSRGVVALGVRPGDRVAIWAPNTWEWVAAALGIQMAGATLVTINTRFKGAEAHEVLARSRARLLFTVTAFLGTDYVQMVRGAGPLPDLASIVVLRGDAQEGTLTLESFRERADEVPAEEALARARAVAPGDIADILFTSGTTGRPKGVPSSHAQNVRVFREWSAVVGIREGDRYLVIAPFFHAFGYKAGWLAALMRGATVYPMAKLDVTALLEKIERERITVLPGPPALYTSMLESARRDHHDLGSLRLAVTGAATIPVELIHRMRRELGFRDIITAYGLTETTGVVTMCHLDDDAETIATTSGRAISGVDIRVAPDGEIEVHGYNVMCGYLDDPELTAATMTSDGWLRTGDIGAIDARGNLRITDRKKDIFIVGGFKASPAEVENVLSAHESVAEAAVIGIPDARLGEVPAAFVVLRREAGLSEATAPGALIDWTRERLANYKVPRRIEIVPELPRNASGKVLKDRLRERMKVAAEMEVPRSMSGAERGADLG